MIYSNNHRLNLSGWLKKYNNRCYQSSLKLQKFLLLYELYSKAEGKSYDLTRLKGYKRGPVFSDVWGDYTKDREEFDSFSESVNLNNSDEIDINIANKVSFLVSVLSETELSDLSHKLTIWASKKDRIDNGEKQVPLSEEDISENDMYIINTLSNLYSLDTIYSSDLIPIDDYTFVINKKQLSLFNEEHYDTLIQLVKNESDKLHNPIFIEIDNEGRLLVD